MHRRTLLIAALALVLPACETTTDPEEVSFAGTYSLQTYNGHTLPHTADGLTKVSGTLELKTNNTWTLALVERPTGGANETWNNNGTYTISGNNLVLHSVVENNNINGTFSGTQLTVNGDDGVYVLKKN